MTTFYYHRFYDSILDTECFIIRDGMFVTCEREDEVDTFFVISEF